MAIKVFSTDLSPSNRSAYAESTDGTGAILTQLTADIAAAQAIGAGDASAEIDAIDATFQTLSNPVAAGEVVVAYDDVQITTKNQLRAALRQALEAIERTPLLSD